MLQSNGQSAAGLHFLSSNKRLCGSNFRHRLDTKNGWGRNKNFGFLGQLAQPSNSRAPHLDEDKEHEVAEVVRDGVVGRYAHEGGEGHELPDHELGFVVQVLALQLRVAVQLQPTVAHAFVRECGEGHELLHGEEQQLDVGRMRTERLLAATLIKRVRG